MTDENDDAALRARIHDEMADSIDEERELEMDDERLPGCSTFGDAATEASIATIISGAAAPAARADQAAGWAMYKGLKVVVLFEAATPRARAAISACRNGSIRASADGGPVGADRARAQLMVFSATRHLPAAGEIVLFDRSWYNCAGVERVMGLSAEDVEEFFRTVPGSRMLVRLGIILIKYWFSITDQEQNLAS